MIDLSNNKYTHQQILDMLANSPEYIIKVLRSGTEITRLCYNSAKLDCNSNKSVKYSAFIEALDDDKINWNTDQIQFVVLTNGIECPLVPLLPVKVSKKYCGGKAVKTVAIECFDETIDLQDSSIGQRLYLPKGMLYSAAIEQFLRQAAYQSIDIEPSSQAFSCGREEWEIDTSYLTVINQLLAEINYTSLYITLDGVVSAKKYRESNPNTIQYIAGQKSVIFPDKEITLDRYRKCNFFVGTAINHLDNSQLIFEYEISSPDIIVSSSNTRLKKKVREFNCPDYQSLVDCVVSWGRREVTSSQSAVFTTAIMPHHEVFETLMIECNGLSGFYKESGWTIDFCDKTMTHFIEEVI